MPSLFGRKRPPKPQREDSGVSAPPQGISSSLFGGTLAATKSKAGFGSQTSFRSNGTSPTTPATTRRSSSRNGLSPGLSRALSDGSSSDFAESDGPLDLKYGYLTEPLRSLEVGVVAEVVRLCGHQIKQRGLQMPLILSTRALDITKEGSTSLISTHIHDRDAWYGMLDYANPHDLGAMIKYALGHTVNNQGRHGVLGYEIYERWRMAERQSNYNPIFVKTHLLSQLPSATASLLHSLLDLLAATATYTSVNGSSPKKLSAIFSSYIFGLPADEPFERTYAAFTRFTNATEHLLLAFIRGNTDQLGGVPPKLKQFVYDYPNCLSLPTAAIRPDTQLRDVKRVSRLCRFYTPDLIQTAGTWDVPRSKSWNALYPWVVPSTDKPALPAYAPSYKHLLNIRDEEEGGGGDNEHQKFKTTTEKDWFSFATAGFSAEPTEKLKFDLNESARQRHRGPHRNTRDWTNFSEQGFLGQDILDRDLSFDSTLAESVANLREDKIRLDKLVRKTEKRLPDFPYDVTPHEGRPILVDEYFFEAWADTLVSSGWLRDEIKDSNWVMIQYRSRPPAGTSNPADPDGRTEDQWFLIEESVPSDYRYDLEIGKTKKSNRLSFLRPSRKKTVKPLDINFSNTRNMPATIPAQGVDTSVFNPGTGGPTRYMNFDRPPSQQTERNLAGPMHLQITQSAASRSPSAAASPVSPAFGALPGTMTSQPQSPAPAAIPRPASAQGQYLTGKEKGLKRRSTSFDFTGGRGLNLVERLRSRRHRNTSISSLSEAENISRPPSSQSFTEFGVNGSNSSWVGIMRRGTRSSGRPSADGANTPRRSMSFAGTAPPPSVRVRSPSATERALPQLPDQDGSTVRSMGGKSSIEAVEELGSGPRPQSVATSSEAELWRGSRFGAMTPEPLAEEDEDGYYSNHRPYYERPRAPSPESIAEEEPQNIQDAPTVQSVDVTADHTTNVPPAPVQSPHKVEHERHSVADEDEDLAPPIPLKTPTAPAAAAPSGPHSERVAKLVAMYSNRGAAGARPSSGVNIQKKPVPSVPGEQAS